MSEDARKLINTKSTKLKRELSNILKRGSSKQIFLKKGERTLLKIPLTVGVGTATAAILMNAPLTAISAILALSCDVNIKVQSKPEEPDNA